MTFKMGSLSLKISPDLAHAGCAQPLVFLAVLFSVKSRQFLVIGNGAVGDDSAARAQDRF